MCYSVSRALTSTRQTEQPDHTTSGWYSRQSQIVSDWHSQNCSALNLPYPYQGLIKIDGVFDKGVVSLLGLKLVESNQKYTSNCIVVKASRCNRQVTGSIPVEGFAFS